MLKRPFQSNVSSQSNGSTQRRGFTLVELLVVMSIIAILVAALLPVVGAAQKRAKIAATNALIKTLNAGLELYRNEFDTFPPSPNGGTNPDDDGSLFRYLMGKEGRGLVSNVGTPREKRLAPFLSIPVEFTKKNGTDIIVIDSFGLPIKYFNCKAYVDAGKNSKDTHNPDSVDIWSYGPDKKKDPDLIEPGSGLVEDPTKSTYPSNIKNW